VGNSVPAAALVEVGRAVTVGSTVVVVDGVAALVGASVRWSKVGWSVGCWTVVWGDGLGAMLDVRKLLLLVVLPVPAFNGTGAGAATVSFGTVGWASLPLVDALLL
jgi:hypothetical protein